MFSKFFKKSGYKVSDTRRSPRIKATYLVRYLCIDGTEQPVVKTANTRELSTGGLSFLTGEPPAENATLRLRVLVPLWDEPVSAFARVVRVAESRPEGVFKVSVAFSEISRPDFQKLERFIKSRTLTRESRFLFDENKVNTREAGARP